MESLREELEIFQGPIVHGWPTWIIYDPARERYIRITYKDMRILEYWDLKSVDLILQKVNENISSPINKADIESFYMFLKTSGLLKVISAQDTQRMALSVKKTSWLKWLIHHYLFVRIKTGNPDKLLEFLNKVFSFLFTKTFICFLGILILIDLFSIGSDWEEYSAGFHEFLTPEGILMGSLAIAISKICHEFGHGMTTKHFGCKVPACGIAFLVMAPVLWTDTTQAWTIVDNKKRLLIDASGMIAEIILASFASLLWVIIPDGSVRHFLFILSSTTWIMAVLVNLSPLMRFDGYHILADSLNIPNLMHRAFTYTRWKIREICLNMKEPEPDELSKFQKIAVLIYSPATWIYRFGLFMGIALVVYHAVFRTLGLVLMGIEIGTFIIAPIIRELIIWIKMIREKGMTKRAYITFGILGTLLLITLLPIKTSLILQGVVKPVNQFPLVSREGVIQSYPHNNQHFKKGDIIIQIDSNEYYNQLKGTEKEYQTDVDTLNSIQESTSIGELKDSESKVIHAEAKIKQLKNQLKNLNIIAPFDGFTQDMDTEYSIGNSVSAHKILGSLVNNNKWEIVTYIPESDIPYLKIGDSATFIQSGTLVGSYTAKVSAIAHGSIQQLKDIELSSLYKGNIQSKKDEKGNIVPDYAVYRVVLQFDKLVQFQHKIIGHVLLKIHESSFIVRVFRKTASLFIQESNL